MSGNDVKTVSVKPVRFVIAVEDLSRNNVAPDMGSGEALVYASDSRIIFFLDNETDEPTTFTIGPLSDVDKIAKPLKQLFDGYIKTQGKTIQVYSEDMGILTFPAPGTNSRICIWMDDVESPTQVLLGVAAETA